MPGTGHGAAHSLRSFTEVEAALAHAAHIYDTGAYVWNDPSAFGWKSTAVVRSVSIEYLQQNRVRMHIDR